MCSRFKRREDSHERRRKRQVFYPPGFSRLLARFQSLDSLVELLFDIRCFKTFFRHVSYLFSQTGGESTRHSTASAHRSTLGPNPAQPNPRKPTRLSNGCLKRGPSHLGATVGQRHKGE